MYRRVLRLVRAFLGAIVLLPLVVALLYGSAPAPDWHWDRLWWRTQSRTPATVTSILPNGIRNGRTQKQNYSLNVTNCPGLFSPLGTILLPN